jgi:putative Holliday junction resolvase
MKGRILAVDPGDKRIGLAVSDPSGLLASPLRVIEHISRVVDAGQIAAVAAEFDVVLVIVGQALNDEGVPTPEGRKAARLAEAIQSQTDRKVLLWDESFSTQTARSIRLAMGAPRSKRRGHMDEIAAAVILQNFLDFSSDSRVQENE